MKTSTIRQIKSWRILTPVKICRRHIHSWITSHILKKYWYWRIIHEYGYIKKRAIRREVGSLPLQPEFTLITRIEKGENIQHFSETIRSVLSQFYPHWEWYILCEQNLSRQISNLIPEKQQNRIKISVTSEKEELQQLFNNAAGEYAGFLSPNDALAPFALSEIVRKINENPAFDLFFSDEDHLNKKNRRCDPWFKPEFNIYNLRSCNYLIHFLVLRKSLANKIHWVESINSDSGLNFYDLILRLTEIKPKICHIPAVLYHSRKPRLTDFDSEKEYSPDPADLLALRNHLQRMNIKAEVLPNNYPDSFRIHYDVQGEPLVSIIIPNKDQKAVLSRCIESILNKTTYPNYEILIIENNSTESETFEYYQELSSDPGFQGQILTWEKPFNYSAINNRAIKNSSGEYVLLLNNDTEISTPNWIEEMLGLARQPDVGAVGVKLLFPDGSLQHGGAGFDRFIPDSVYHFGQKSKKDSCGYYGIFRKINAFSAVTGACMIFSKEKFYQTNGFDEKFNLDLNDVDLCLQFLNEGWNNVFTPYVCLFHHESLSRGYDITSAQIMRAKNSYAYLCEKWKDFILPADPFLSPYLRFDQYGDDIYH